jgi:hypothetical protein
MSLVGVVEGVVAIDDKTVGGSQDGLNTALYMISAYATASGLCLAQEDMRGKGKEIEGIKVLLETLTLKGSIVTMDALGCHTKLRSIGRQYSSLTCQDFSHFFRITMV